MSFFTNTTRETPATRNVIESIAIGVFFTGLSYIVGLVFSWPMTQGWNLWLEIFCVFTSYSCTYLCIRERRIQYPIGAISTLAYAWLFYRFGLNASAIVNAWLTLQLLYGWFRWRSDADTRPVTFVKLWQWPLYLLATGAFYLVCYWADVRLGGSLAWMDVTILVGTILAQWLLDNKKWENWAVWFFVVDIIGSIEYFRAGLYIAGFQYAVFLLTAIYGAINWRVSQKKEKKVLAGGPGYVVCAGKGCPLCEPFTSVTQPATLAV